MVACLRGAGLNVEEVSKNPSGAGVCDDPIWLHRGEPEPSADAINPLSTFNRPHIQ